jgi:hypothetical protein
VVLWVFCTSFPLSIILFHFEKNNKHGLSNSSWLRLVPCCQEERNEVHQCRISNTSYNLQDYKIYAMVICMFDEDFLNNVLQPPKDNPWPTHSTNYNYRIWLLRHFDYLLGFVSPNKYSLEIVINKKWPKNQSNSEEDEYKSLTLVYYKETNAMVPLVKAGLQTPPIMQRYIGAMTMSKCWKLC